MTSRKALRGVISGFLGTYTSRYTDYSGYWLFGFFICDVGHAKLDLLSEVNQANTPVDVAWRLAHLKFLDQLRKHGLPGTTVREATLDIDVCSELYEVMSGDHLRRGYNVRFRASVFADYGRHFEGTREVFVARHDKRLERQSNRTPA